MNIVHAAYLQMIPIIVTSTELRSAGSDKVSCIDRCPQ